MKKICFLLIFVSTATLLGAQKPTWQKGKALYASGGEFSAFKALSCRDTLNQYQQRTTSGYTIYTVTDGGYVFGVSNDGSGGVGSITDATGLHFDSVGTVNVTEVFVWIAEKKITGGADILKCELYNAGNDSLPTQLLGFGTANMAFVDTNTSVNFNTMLGMNRFTIDNGTNQVTGDFVVAVNYSAFDDTLGIVSNVIGDGFGEQRCKQLTGVNFLNQWVAAANLWNNGMDCDPMIIPVYECLTGRENDAIANRYLTLEAAFPNPARTETTLRFWIPEPSDVRISLFDNLGRTAWDSGVQPLNTGSHEVSLDISDLAPGTYYYTVSTGKTRMTRKLTLNR